MYSVFCQILLFVTTLMPGSSEDEAYTAPQDFSNIPDKDTDFPTHSRDPSNLSSRRDFVRVSVPSHVSYVKVGPWREYRGNLDLILDSFRHHF